MTRNIKKGIEYAGYLILLVLLFHVMYQAALLNVDAHHDGTVFNPALTVSKGGVLFRDASTYYGPLLVYIQALFLKLFGQNLAALKLSAVVFYVLSYMLYFHIFKRLMPKAMVLASEVALFLVAPYWMVVFHAWSSVYALFFILCMMYLCIRFLEAPNSFSAVLCGVCAGLLLMIRTPVGLVFVLAGGVFWAVCRYAAEKTAEKAPAPKAARQKLPLLLQFGIGAAAGLLPFLLTFCIQGTLKDWWNDCVMWGFRWFAPAGSTAPAVSSAAERVMPAFSETAGQLAASVANTGGGSSMLSFIRNLFHNLLPVRDSGIFIVLPVVSLFLFFYMLYLLWQGRKEEQGSCGRQRQILLLCLCWFCLASWHQYFPVSDRRHWYWAAFPMMGILSYCIYECLGKISKGWRLAAAVLALFTISSNTIAERYDYYQVKKETYQYELSEEYTPYLKGIKLSRQQLDFYETYCMLVREMNQDFPALAIENQTNLVLLDSLNNNDRAEIDRERKPFIVSFREDQDGTHYPDYFAAVMMEYSEEDYISNLYDVYFYYPSDFSR